MDEIQKVNGWEHWVRSKYDRKEPVKILVTGSTAELLSSEYSSVLTGRHLQLSVTPLNVTNIAREAGVARTTVAGFLQILEDTLELSALNFFLPENSLTW